MWAPVIKYNSDQPRSSNGEFASNDSEFAPVEAANAADAKETVERGIASFKEDGGEIQSLSKKECANMLDVLATERDNISDYKTFSKMDERGWDFTESALDSGESGFKVSVATVDGLGIAGAISYKIQDDAEFGGGKYVLIDYLGTTQIAKGTGSALANEVYKFAAARGLSVQGEPYLEGQHFWARHGWVEDPEEIGGYYSGLTADQVKKLAVK